MRGQRSAGALRCLRRGLGAALLGALSSCARLGYELSADPLPGSDPFAGLSPVSSELSRDAGVLQQGSTADASDVPTVIRGALDDEFGQLPPRQRVRRGSPGDGSPGDDPPPDGGHAPPSTGPCALLGTEQIINGFDSAAPGAGLEARGAGNPTVSWIDSVGAPELGALDFRNPFGGGEVVYDGALGDLRARGVLLNVQVVSGSGVRVRLFAESGSPLQRARGVYTSPALAQWDCVRLVPSEPASAESGFDAANIVSLGLEIEGSGSVQVYLDEIAY